MAVKKLGAPADSPLRKFKINRRKGGANTADKDKIADLARVITKRRLDAWDALREREALNKEIWDD